MITERNIWAAAKQMIDQHGEDAATEAAMMADKFAAEDYSGAARIWHRIMLAIYWLQDRSGPDPFKVEH
jgi:dihydrodipicolinate synthase/N-acetylneuraminate lyase